MIDTTRKIQLVLNVIDGKAHPSVLKDILPEQGVEEPNFIKFAVDHIVGWVLQQASTNKNQFRFKIEEHGNITMTPWQAESSQFSASMAMGQLRKEHPHAAIAIERGSGEFG